MGHSRNAEIAIGYIAWEQMDGWNRIGATLPGSHPRFSNLLQGKAHFTNPEKGIPVECRAGRREPDRVTTPTTRCWLHLPTKPKISHDAPTQSFSWRL